MILLDRKTYNDTLSVLRNEKPMSPVYTNLKEYIYEQFGITAINFAYKNFKMKPMGRPKKTKNLKCLLSSRDDYNKTIAYKSLDNGDRNHPMMSCKIDEYKQALIASKFFELAKQYNCPLHENAEQIWVTYTDFGAENMDNVIRKVKFSAEKAIVKKFPDVGIWRIITSFFGVVIFYLNDKQKTENEKNGISVSIQKDYFSMVKEHDEFNFYKEKYITFDSKENLDNNYSGNLYYYFK